jgi:restriction alleviation protein, Lar family
MTELKPCPFCGQSVRLDVVYNYFHDTVIYCDECDMVFTLDDCNATSEQIAEAWNRRAENDD